MDISIKNKDPEFLPARDLKRSDVCILKKYKQSTLLSEFNKNLLLRISNPGTPLLICVSGASLVVICLSTAEIIPITLFYDVEAEFKLCDTKLDVTIL